MLVGQAQRQRHRGLQRTARDVGEELLRGAYRGHQPGRGAHPADLPPGDREGLPGAGDGDCALPHPGEARQRHVWHAVVGHVLVDLVGDHQQVTLACQLGDPGQLRAGQHGTGRVVRRVEQHGGGFGVGGEEIGDRLGPYTIRTAIA